MMAVRLLCHGPKLVEGLASLDAFNQVNVFLLVMISLPLEREPLTCNDRRT